MGKFFTENNKDVPHNSPNRPNPNTKGSFFTPSNAKPKAPARAAPAPAPQQPGMLEQAGEFGMDALRNFNDSWSFGLYPAFLEMTGLDPQATQRLEESDPYAAIIGDLAGYAIPGAAASKAVGSVVKPLARNTIPAIVGRESLAAGGVAAADTALRGEDLDPIDIALQMALGGAAGGVLSGATALAGRAVSTGARVRGMGSELTPADKEAAEAFYEYAADQGIPLNIKEAVETVAPSRSQTVRQGYERNVSSPQGNAVASSFNEARGPQVEQVGRDLVESMGGGIPTIEAAEAAKTAIRRNKDLVRDSARPYYQQAELKPDGTLRRMPPNWVPKDGYTRVAIESVGDDPGLMKGLTLTSASPTNPRGIVPPNNSIIYLDAAKKELDAMADAFYTRGQGNRAEFARSEAQDLLTAMDRVAPTYPVARDISEGGTQMVQGLEAGPLGSIMRSNKSSTQGAALFGATNTAEKEASSIAARNLARAYGPDGVPVETGVPTGILANTLESSLSKGESGWAKKALPTKEGQQVADEVLATAGMDDLSGILGAARAVDPKLPPMAAHENTGLFGTIYTMIRDIGTAKTAKKLQDPKWIKRLGRMGITQKMVQETLKAAAATAQAEMRDDQGR